MVFIPILIPPAVYLTPATNDGEILYKLINRYIFAIGPHVITEISVCGWKHLYDTFHMHIHEKVACNCVDNIMLIDVISTTAHCLFCSVLISWIRGYVF